MANVIEELLIGIGFKVDDDALGGVDSAMDNMASNALKLGGILGAGFGLKELTLDTANANDRLGKFSILTGISADKVRALGFALEAEGGQADDAYGQMDKLQGVLNKLSLGDYASIVEQLSKAGIGTEGLENVRSLDQLLGFILKKGPQLDALQRRTFGDVFGLSPDMMRVAMGGQEGFETYEQASEERQPVISGLLDASAEFNGSLQNLGARFNGMTEKISMYMLPYLTDIIDRMDREVGEQQHFVFDLFDEYQDEIGAAFKGAAVIGAAKFGTKMLGMLGGIPGLVLSLIAGELVDVFSWDQKDVKEKLGVDLPDWFFKPIDELTMDDFGGDTVSTETEQLDTKPRSSRFDFIQTQGQQPKTPKEISTSAITEFEKYKTDADRQNVNETYNITVNEAATPEATGRAVSEAIKAQKETRARGKLGNTIS